jgi:hypothetical protein
MASSFTAATTERSERSLHLTPRMSHLQRLEAESIHIFREVAAEFQKPVMLYSIGKDSSVLLRLAQKAFAPAPLRFPLLFSCSRLRRRFSMASRIWRCSRSRFWATPPLHAPAPGRCFRFFHDAAVRGVGDLSHHRGREQPHVHLQAERHGSGIERSGGADLLVPDPPRTGAAGRLGGVEIRHARFAPRHAGSKAGMAS